MSNFFVSHLYYYYLTSRSTGLVGTVGTAPPLEDLQDAPGPTDPPPMSGQIRDGLYWRTRIVEWRGRALEWRN